MNDNAVEDKSNSDRWAGVDMNKLLKTLNEKQTKHSKIFSIKTEEDAENYSKMLFSNVHVSNIYIQTLVNISQPIFTQKIEFTYDVIRRMINALASSELKEKKIEILSVSMRLFKDTIREFVELLQDATSKGCSVKIVTANPQKQENFNFLHPEEQQIQSKDTIDLFIAELRALPELTKKSINVYQQNFAIYSSTYRIGTLMVVVPHVYKKVSKDTNILYFEWQPEFTTFVQQFNDIIMDTVTTKLVPL